MEQARARARHPWSVTAVFALAYLVAVAVGRQTLVPGTGLAMFWPAAGVAALWLLSSPGRRWVGIDGALLVLVAAAVNLATGSTPVAALLLGSSNLVQAFVLRVLVRRGPRGRLVLEETRDGWLLGVSAVAASVASLPIGAVVSWLGTGSVSWLTVASWVVRNVAGTVVVVAAVVLVHAAYVARVSAVERRPTLTHRVRPRARLELLALAASSLVVGGWVFGGPGHLPLAFAVLAFSVWVGQRFAPVVAVLHGVLGAVGVVLGTALGLGAFGGIADLAARLLVGQLYLVLAFGLGVLLSLAAAERLRLVEEVTRSRAELRRQMQLTEAVTDQLPGGVVVLDADGRPLLTNSAAGRAAEGRPRFTTVEGAPLHWREALLLDVPVAAEAATADVVMVDDTERRVLEVSSRELRVADDTGLRVATWHDVTRQHLLLRDVQAFAGVVAHDLRTPLGAVGVHAEVLERLLDADEVDVARARRHLVSVYQAADQMKALIEDLLTYSHSQFTALEPEPVCLDDLVAECAEHLLDLYPGRSPRIEVVGPLGTVHADVGLLRQLFDNVLGNAVKYVAPDVCPHVVVDAQPDAERRTVTVRVHDNGIGIPEEERHRVFDPFHRAAGVGDIPGTGLGLAIAAQVVERHGGHVWATDGRGGLGTTVALTLPTA